MTCNYADEDLSRAIARYLLAGWTLLYRTRGDVWSAYYAEVTDGVVNRLIDHAGDVVRERRAEEYTGAGGQAPVEGPRLRVPICEVTAYQSRSRGRPHKGEIVIPWADTFRVGTEINETT